MFFSLWLFHSFTLQKLARPPIRPYVGYRDENALLAVLRDNIYDLCVLPLLFLQPVTPSPLLWLENFLTSRWLVVKKGTIAVLNFIEEYNILSKEDDICNQQSKSKVFTFCPIMMY